MKEYIDDFLKSARRVTDALVVKTSETVDAAKLEIEMRKLTSALDKEYKALGQIMFQVEKGALKKDESIIQTACKRIQEKLDQLAQLQDQKDKAKAEKKQKEENVVQEPDMPVQDDETQTEDTPETPMPERGEDGYFVLKFCPECKVGNHPDAVRCVNCGAEFPKQGDRE